jgi:hypothetical protein
MRLEIVRVLQVETEYGPALRRIQEIEKRHVASVGTDEQLALRRSAARMAFIAATRGEGP